MASVISDDDIPEQPESTATTPTKEQDDTKMDDNEPQEEESTTAGNNKSPKTPSKKSNSKSIPYTDVITNAIMALKDRTGSSSMAIQKWIVNNHPNMDPAKLKKKMNFTLKNGVKSKR
ncbi:MAG: histone H1/5 [Bacillariaceae sp.]|jgi:histone H1/5